MKIYLAAPRGFCAGVFHAVEIVEKALEIFGSPIYILKEIVHNKHVVDRLTQKGAYSVQSIDEVPSGSYLIFSAHGVPPQFHGDAAQRGIKVIDATCPLVTKVHREAILFSQKGFEIFYIGHAGHDEVVGVLAELKEGIHLIQDNEEALKFEFDPPAKPEKLIYLTQTTLSVSETQEIIQTLKKRFPQLQDPPKEDICYATTNRQLAVKELAAQSDLVLVIGSKNSSNSQRLKDAATQLGKKSYLIDSAVELEEAWFQNIQSIGITAGASAPEDLVEDLITKLKTYFKDASLELIQPIEEHMNFVLPKLLRDKLKEKNHAK